MRSTSSVLLGALLALCLGGPAAANPPAVDDSPETADLRAVTQMELDGALEQFAMLGGRPSIQELSGPSSMDCQDARTRSEDEVETCVVRTSAPVQSMPAALAQQ